MHEKEVVPRFLLLDMELRKNCFLQGKVFSNSRALKICHKKVILRLGKTNYQERRNSILRSEYILKKTFR